MERTHPTQQDEHLRRIREANPVRAGLQWVAERLTARFPTDEVTPAALHAIARGWAVQLYDWSEQSDLLAHKIRAALPEIEPGETRKHYADRIRFEGTR